MPNYKISFFFESSQEAFVGSDSSLGWTEVWYMADGPGDIDSVFTHYDVQKYLELRRLILNRNYRLPFVRISEESNRHLFKVFNVWDSAGQAGTVLSSAQVNCCILADLTRLPHTPPSNDTSHHRRFLLRGLDRSIIRGNIIDVTVGYWNLIQSFLSFVAQKPAGQAVNPALSHATKLGIKYHDRTLAPHLIEQIIKQAGKYTITVQPAIFDAVTPGVPQRVKIYGNKDLKSLNKTWTLLQATAGAGGNNVLGQFKRATSVAYQYDGPGTTKYQVVGDLYGTLDQWTVIGLRNKKTGRVFHQLRGRARSEG